MYTGIIDHCGEIIKIEKSNTGVHLSIRSHFSDFSDFMEGESITIDGICVTALQAEADVADVTDRADIFKCDLSPETLKLTTAGDFKVGQKVNLERSLKLSDRMGGHFVMGHVDTTAEVQSVESHDAFVKISFDGLSKESLPYFSKKGSVSVNGISLTINEVSESGFSVMLIPHTLERTNLQYLKKGDRVNIEFDTIARIVIHQLQQSQLAGLT